MKRIAPLALATLVFSACSFLLPYSITFTTPNESVVNPSEDSLDFVLSAEAYAYLSAVSCSDGTSQTFAPNMSPDTLASNVYNLGLEKLQGVSTGSLCNVTVTVFDKTTATESHDFISLYVLEKPEVEPELPEAIVEEQSEETEEALEENEEAVDDAGDDYDLLEDGTDTEAQTVGTPDTKEEPAAEPVLEDGSTEDSE